MANNLPMKDLSVSTMDRERKLMMETNTMLLSRIRCLFLCISVLLCSAAAPLTCPGFVKDFSGEHALDNVSVFDGPPEQRADLIPDAYKGTAVWDARHIDPYLVCRYQGTGRTVAFHAVGARFCAGRHKPIRAYCR